MGAVVSSGDVRAAPIRTWRMLRNVQPPRKWTIPASANAMIPQALASRTAVSSPVATVTLSSTVAATASWRKVDAYGSPISRTARRLSPWKRPKPIPEAAAHKAPVTSDLDDAHVRRGLLDRAAEVEGCHLGVVEHVLRLAVEQHPAALHHDPVLRDLQPEAHVLLDEQDRPAARDHALHALMHHLERLRVEPKRWLVEQHHLRLHHQRTRELDHPALPAGEIAGLVVRALLEHREGVRQLLVAPLQEGLVAAPHVGTHENVLLDREVREEPVRLRDLRDAHRQDLGRRATVDPLALEPDLAEPRVEQPADRAEDRRLPGAVRPDDAGDAVLLELEVDTLQDVATAVARDHSLDTEDRA